MQLITNHAFLMLSLFVLTVCNIVYGSIYPLLSLNDIQNDKTLYTMHYILYTI